MAATPSVHGVRLRVEFYDPRGLFTKAQRREGFRRSWLLLRSKEIATVGDLADHIQRTFGLQESCPHGLILSMDGFLLPLSESTCLLKDEDVIRVRRRNVKMEKVLDNSLNKQWIHSSAHNEPHIAPEDKHVEMTEAWKNLAGHLVEHEEEHKPLEDSYKGEDMKRDQLKKRKRSKRNVEMEKVLDNCMIKEGIHTSVHEEHHIAPKDKHVEMTDVRKNMVGDLVELEEPEPLEVVPKGEDRQKEELTELMKSKRNVETEKVLDNSMNKQGIHSSAHEQHHIAPKDECVEMTDVRNNVVGDFVEHEELELLEVVPKGADRQKEQLTNLTKSKGDVKMEEVLDDSQNKQWIHSSAHQKHHIAPKDKHIEMTEDQNDLEGYFVDHKEENEPLEAASKGEDRKREQLQKLERHDYDEGTLERANCASDVHGCSVKIPSRSARRKKEKREWFQLLRKIENGMAPQTLQTSPGLQVLDLEADVEENEQQICREKSQWNGMTDEKAGQNCIIENISSGNISNPFDSGPSENHDTTREKLMGSFINIEQLHRLTRLPKEGDVIAYRLFESSSLVSKLSPFRVGNVTSYDSKTMNVVLIPVPGYPIFPDKNMGVSEHDLQSTTSPYKDDGSLEIKYSFLADVRLLNDYSEATLMKSWDVSLVKEIRPKKFQDQIKFGEAQTRIWNANNKPTNNTSWSNQVTMMPSQFGFTNNRNICSIGRNNKSILSYTGSRSRGQGCSRGRGRGYIHGPGRCHSRGSRWDNSTSLGGYGSVLDEFNDQMNHDQEARGQPDGERMDVKETEIQLNESWAGTNKQGSWPQQSNPSNGHNRINTCMPPRARKVMGGNNCPRRLNVPGLAGHLNKPPNGRNAKGHAWGHKTSSCRGRGRKYDWSN